MSAAADKRAARLSMPSDEALVVAIRGGDLSGLGLLFDRYGDDVRRVLSRFGAASSDLDDLVQQTFLEVMRASHRFREGANVRSWLFGLAAILARRNRRSVRRAIERLEAWAREPSREPDEATPDEELQLEAEAALARRALLALPAKKREAFVLVALEGMTCADAAEALGVPIATVWTRLHYARAELRRALDRGRK